MVPLVFFYQDVYTKSSRFACLSCIQTCSPLVLRQKATNKAYSKRVWTTFSNSFRFIRCVFIVKMFFKGFDLSFTFLENYEYNITFGFYLLCGFIRYFYGIQLFNTTKKETSTNVEVSFSNNYKINLVYWVPITLNYEK